LAVEPVTFGVIVCRIRRKYTTQDVRFQNCRVYAMKRKFRFDGGS
jgi:hypothetical protein